jgi:hypothetical protein
MGYTAGHVVETEADAHAAREHADASWAATKDAFANLEAGKAVKKAAAAAGDATLSVADPSADRTGHLVKRRVLAAAAAEGRRRRASGGRQDLRRAGVQRRRDGAVQPAGRLDRRAPHRRVQQDNDVHAVHHHSVGSRR